MPLMLWINCVLGHSPILSWLRRSENLGIKIEADEENSVIKISDNGIGMNEDEIVQNLGTIARSGASKF